jgi:hypothetical protein
MFPRGLSVCGATFFTLLLLTGLSTSASGAQQIFATSYDLYNGGIAGYGNVTLYDDSYHGGSGNNTIPYAYLSGGLGDLTDGIAATQNWSDCGGVGPCTAQNGPYVGWNQGHLSSPSVTFHFSPNTRIGEVDISMNYGYHASPVDFLMGGVSETRTVTPNYTGAGANQWYDFTSLGLSGNALTITFHYNQTPPAGPADWILVSEVQFHSPVSSPVPLPAAVLLFAPGLVGLEAMRRRLKK